MNRILDEAIIDALTQPRVDFLTGSQLARDDKAMKSVMNKIRSMIVDGVLSWGHKTKRVKDLSLILIDGTKVSWERDGTRVKIFINDKMISEPEVHGATVSKSGNASGVRIDLRSIKKALSPS